MRLRSALLALPVLFLTVSAANAATSFSVFGSYFDTDDYDEAVGAGFRVAFGTAVQFEVGGSYYDEFGSSFDFDLDNPGFENVELKLDVIPIDAGVRFNFGESPFYVAGGGTYFLLDSSGGGSVDDEFGLYARAGLQFQHLFLEVGYRNVEGTVEDLDLDDASFDDSFDFDLTGFFANVGWTF